MNAFVSMAAFFLLAGCAILFILGLLKPGIALWWSQKKDRKTVLKFYPFGAVSAVITGVGTTEGMPWWWYILSVVVFLMWIGYLLELRGVKARRDEKSIPDRKEKALPKQTEDIIAREVQALRRFSSAGSQKVPSIKSPSLTWGKWSEVHSRSAQITRQKRAWGCYVDFVDITTGRARMTASGKMYDVTLSGCTCYDFQKRFLPCKHMYRLAMEMGLMDLPKFSNYEEDYTLD